MKAHLCWACINVKIGPSLRISTQHQSSPFLFAKTLTLPRISLALLSLSLSPVISPRSIVMASTTEPTTLKKEEEEEDDSRPPAEDEDTGAQIAPIVKLQEVAVTTGEENEDILIDL